MKTLPLLAGLVVALAAGSAVAQIGVAQGRFSGFGGLQWESSCNKPHMPSAQFADEYQTQAATRDYQRYTSCLADQATADSQYAANQVIREAEDELDEVKADARRAGWNVR